MEEQYGRGTDHSFAVREILKGGNNYEEWSVQMKAWLSARDLWHVVAAKRFRGPESDEQSSRQHVSLRRKNAAALHAILISCSSTALAVIKEIESARVAWATLAGKYGRKSAKRTRTKGQIEEEGEEEAENRAEKSPDESEEESSSEESESSGSDDDDENKKINTRDVENFRRYEPFFKAVFNGEWNKAQTFLDQHPEAVRARAPYSGKTALHIAISRGHLHIAEKLVELMAEQDLEIKGMEDGLTPLGAAVEVGSLAMAKCLINKNKRLASIPYRPRGLPARHALLCGQDQMARYLYSVTPIKDLMMLDGGRHCAALLSQSIRTNHFDIAMDMLELVPDLAITKFTRRSSPICILAIAKVFPSGYPLTFWQRWIYNCLRVPDCATNHTSIDIQNTEANQIGKARLFYRLQWMGSNLLKLLGIKDIYEMKLLHVQSLELLRRMCQVIERISDKKLLKQAGVPHALAAAVWEGNFEFIINIANANPELVWSPFTARNLFALAIDLRQAKIFSRIYGLHDKQSIASDLDSTKENMLHRAAEIAPPSLLNLIAGPALQMQRELQWFKEVESIATPEAREWLNRDGLKPRALFTEEHKDLVVQGEKWMKDTSSSCTVVGALIVTVTFAAAFTFPGGNHQDTGFPMFINEKLFRVFMISNAIALFTSTTSVLMFLGILTSRYGEDDFLKSLPKKLIIGLSTLFLSIAAMIIAFCAGLSLMFHRQSWIVIPAICLASIPVALFVLMQFPLLVDIFMSTYGPSIFDRKVKRWI